MHSIATITALATIASLSPVDSFVTPSFSRQTTHKLSADRSGNEDGFVTRSEDESSKSLSNRRVMISTSIASLVTVFSALPSGAFPNKITDKWDDRPKRRGPQPKDLGIRTRKDMVGEEYPGLKPCGPAPNCFCSTDDIADDPEHNIPAWAWPSRLGDDRAAAFRELESVVKAYKPGQGGIDGGGFSVVTSDVEKAYFYAQFEALKNGYIDDFEVAFLEGKGDREVQVRTSSRVGYLDYGVNAKRVNYIAKGLEDKGWTAPGVDPKTHPDYIMQNSSR